MKKIKLLMAATAVAATLFLVNDAKAQSTKAGQVGFGIAVDLGVPTGDIHDGSSFELGGDARAQFGLTDNVAFTLTAGYYNFFAKSYSTPLGTFKGDDYGIIPLKAGVKAYFNPNVYFGGEVGAGFETVSNGSTKLLLAPTLGYSGSGWDLGVRYENFSGQGANFGAIGIRLGISF